MNRPSSLIDPLARVRGLGSAKGGVTHWWMQRLTALALLPLAIWLVFFIVSVLHCDYAGARVLVAKPSHSILLVAFLIALFWHMQIGLQVIIEDYVHAPWMEYALQITVKLLCVFGAIVSVFSVVRIALGH